LVNLKDLEEEILQQTPRHFLEIQIFQLLEQDTEEDLWLPMVVVFLPPWETW
jgi:hypothetical protein